MPHSNNPTASDLRDGRNGRAKRNERTGPQVAISTWGLTSPELHTNYPTDSAGTSWYTKVRAMRVDPTISLIRDLVLGPILAAEWSVAHTKEAPDGAVELVRKNLLNIRRYLIENALVGMMDFGWQAFEKVWAVDADGNIVIDKIKPLLQDVTCILVDTNNGEFIGTVQDWNYDKPLEIKQIGDDIVSGYGFLKRKDVLLCNINVEGTYWYGRPIMHNVVTPYDGWKDVNTGADRYDKKIAGAHWVVYYPLGQTKFNGVDTDNYDIAKSLIQSLESSGAIAIPSYIDETLQQLSDKNERAWQVELLSDSSSQQSNFVDRLKYYDNLKVRALGFPERSVLEGKFGTKAEAETHSDLAVVIAEYRHSIITEQVSYQLVNDLLRYNFGKEAIGTVHLQPAPIADDLRIFLRSVYQTLMQHDPFSALEQINREEVQEKLGLPRNDESEQGTEFKPSEKMEDKIGENPLTGPPGNTNLVPAPGERTKPD